MAHPPPRVPPDHEIEVGGAVTEPFSLPLAELDGLPRREMTADFHCVAGWSATDLRWEGVPSRASSRGRRTGAGPGAPITHVFQGRDGYRSIVTRGRAGRGRADRRAPRRPAAGGDHGAPVRLVSPSQYGFISTKHLCRIEVHTAEPGGPTTAPAHPPGCGWSSPTRGPGVGGGAQRLRPGLGATRAYRLLIPPIRALAARGGRGGADAGLSGGPLNFVAYAGEAT